jgi:integrase
MRRFEIVKSKTLARTVAIRSKTAEAFDHYIMTYWTYLPKHSGARKEGFLFCDEKGRHLSLRAINRIFETVRERIEGQPQNITPHTMRRFWNYLFSQQVDQAPPERRLTPEEEAQYRMRIMGWSTDTQAKRYNRRHIIEAGYKVSQEMMDRLEAASLVEGKRDS